MTSIEYEISTGNKEEFYTLWKTTKVDLRPRDEEGNVTEHFRLNSVGGNMYMHCHVKFLQNLSKVRVEAIAKVKELGIVLSDDAFDFELKHYAKPSFVAFNRKLKFKKGKWYAEASSDFFKCWKENKDAMRELGWGCWNYSGTWYMSMKLKEQ